MLHRVGRLHAAVSLSARRRSQLLQFGPSRVLTLRNPQLPDPGFNHLLDHRGQVISPETGIRLPVRAEH